MQFGIDNLFRNYQSLSNAGLCFPFTNIYIGFKGVFDRLILLEILEETSEISFLVIHLWMYTQYKFQKHPEILIYSFSSCILIYGNIT